MKYKYKSLGAAMKAQDFAGFLEMAKEMITSDEFDRLKEKSTDSPVSELDLILFAIPKYATKVIENDPPKSFLQAKSCTGELVPNVLEVVEFLLEQGASPNASMKDSETAFLMACQTNSVDLVDKLLSNKFEKADVNTRDGENKGALFYAAMKNNDAVIDLLVTKYGLDVNKKNMFTENRTAIFYAAGHGAEEAFNKMVSLGAKLDVVDDLGYSPHHLMVLAYDKESQEDFEATPEEIDAWQPFYKAAEKQVKDAKAAAKMVGTNSKYKTKF